MTSNSHEDRFGDRLFCNSCANYTKHSRSYVRETIDPILDDHGVAQVEIPEEWSIFECLGCGALKLRVVSDVPWAEKEQISFFPSPAQGKHAHKTYINLPKNLKGLYREVVSAFNDSLYLLCAAGLRALVEGICADKGIESGPDSAGKTTRTLEGKINGLESIVPAGIVRNLHSFRFLGNRALHRLAKPARDELLLALHVIEDLLNVIYDLDYRAQQLFEKATKQSELQRNELRRLTS